MKHANIPDHVTINEIIQQPACWAKTLEILRDARPAIRDFFDRFSNNHDRRQIIITGAGTSSYTGIILESIIRKYTDCWVRAVATTDLVIEPDSYFNPDVATLLVSFARSGDSPESKAAIDLADACPDTCHLIITCNKNGRIAEKQDAENALVIFLPEETNDKGLAMTSSFTNMLLAGILAFSWDRIPAVETQVARLIRFGNSFIDRHLGRIEALAKSGFTQAVFLGSGSLTGIAQESKLKLLELTVGAVTVQHESFLAFRHGPIAVLDPGTLIICLFSNDTHILQYESDLVNSLRKGKFKLGIAQHPLTGIAVDELLTMSDDNADQLCNELYPVCAVLPGQLLGYFTALHAGLDPDSPCTDGSYSRVVQGVNIYPVEI